MVAAGGLLRHPPATPTDDHDDRCENFLYVFEGCGHPVAKTADWKLATDTAGS